jgi:predicted AAA+ superfamily ATPase
LRPHHKNFGKRLIKSPKLYFLDTGLLCYLLQVRTSQELLHRAERGAVFESFVVGELHKNFVHRGEQPRLNFWRDSAGHEVDVLLETENGLIPVEVKSAETVAADFYSDLVYWRNMTGDEGAPLALVYGGDGAFKRSGVVNYPWHAL